MRIDHVCYAAGPEGLLATARRLADALGVSAHEGGVHPRFGTRNMVLPLANGRYIEVVEVLDHPASDKAPFGQATRAASERGGGWFAWVVSVDDLREIETRLGREAVTGNRHTPEGVELTWKQIGIKGLMADPQLPFFLKWDSTENHPSLLDDSHAQLSGLRIAGDPHRVREWLGLSIEGTFETGIEFEFMEDDEAALETVTFATASGPVTI
ncbi:VOC family protein [Ornithinimicrobium sp. Arc0846-15]|nr:VOC family protein [Ornithinimicrobium laminariae]